MAERKNNNHTKPGGQASSLSLSSSFCRLPFLLFPLFSLFPPLFWSRMFLLYYLIWFTYFSYCYSFPFSLDYIFFASLFSLYYQHSYPHLFTHFAPHTFSFVSWTLWGHCGFKPCCAVPLRCYATSPTSPNLPLTQYNIKTHALSLSLTQEGGYTSQRLLLKKYIYGCRDVMIWQIIFF